MSQVSPLACEPQPLCVTLRFLLLPTLSEIVPLSRCDEAGEVVARIDPLGIFEPSSRMSEPRQPPCVSRPVTRGALDGSKRRQRREILSSHPCNRPH